MKTKLALLAAVILAGIGSATAFAGRDGTSFPVAAPKATVADKPAGMACCAMGNMDHAKAADKAAAPMGGMSCHMPKAAAVSEHKSCCK